MAQQDPSLDVVRVLALTPRDAELTARVFFEADICCTSHQNIESLCNAMDECVGAVLLPEERLIGNERQHLQNWIHRQEPWSDVPLLVLTRHGADSSAVLSAIKTLGNVTLLERPVRVSALVSSVRSALRARRRQYQIRDHILERVRLNEALEHRVQERTAVARQRAVQLSALAAELTKAEERERRRLALLLHDHLQQLLVAAKLGLGMLDRSVGEDGRGQLVRVDDLIQESISLSRSLAVELSPPILYEAGLVPAVQWLSRWMQEKHGLRTHISARDEVDPIPESTRVLLFQVVRELLFNVVKHAGVEEARLTLRRDLRNRVHVSVEDDGCGFDVNRTSGANAASNEHFGLFSIDERLRLLGGDINIDSTPGKGTCITIVMESSDGDLAEEDERQDRGSTMTGVATARTRRTHRRRGSRSPGANGGKIRILLVDDHKIVREGLASILRTQNDFEIIAEASDGQSAIELCGRTHPQVVIMDVTMPGMSGVEATREIASRFPLSRVIGLSMHEKADMESAMHSAGAVAYLTKGGPAEQLIGSIRSAASIPA